MSMSLNIKLCWFTAESACMNLHFLLKIFGKVETKNDFGNYLYSSKKAVQKTFFRLKWHF
jgi:hypothetical protein